MSVEETITLKKIISTEITQDQINNEVGIDKNKKDEETTINKNKNRLNEDKDTVVDVQLENESIRNTEKDNVIRNKNVK